MPTYPYLCNQCANKFDVSKSIRQIDDPELCQSCGGCDTRRYLVRVNFNGAGDWDKAAFNKGLGCEVRSNAHAARIAKERGLIEVGSESVEKVIKYQDSKIRAEEDAAFDKNFEPMVYGLKEELRKAK